MRSAVRQIVGMGGPWLFAVGTPFIWSALNAAGPALPVPCSAGACGVMGASQFITGGAATAVATQNSLTVNQTTNSAILNWSSFNIGAGGTVTFKQPSTSSIALNRIFQSSPSQIFGQLSANGQIYLVNLNGFLFGPTSTVNVGSLLVTSLPLALTDANFANGILSPLQNGAAALDATLDPLAVGGRTSVLDVNGSPVLDANGKPLSVQIVVQPGARLTAADQGRLLLAGQSVTNGGALTAPDGQVILAAGAKVYLQADADPGLRGLVVEVDQGGKAWNQLSGSLSAARGNVSMVGLAVNQEGRISATTSVNANGSIRLEAADTHVIGGTAGDLTVSSSHGGTLTIGPQSEMDILPELASTDTAVAAQKQLASTVTLLGEQVILQGGSLTAPGGDLTAIAAANPSTAAANPSGGVAGGDANARIRIDAGTKIDLSGSSASLSVDSNLVAVQLRSSELADDPTQRNGALHGQTVYVDARNPPSKALANVTGEISAVPLNIAQRTETGGNAIFQSEGDAVFANGASLNVSGGSTTYAGGVMQTSYLVGANGQLYPIETANPLLTYVGVVNPTFSQTFDKWGVKEVLPTPGLSSYQPGYVQGAAAGTVQFAAPTLVLQGSLQGSATNGVYQRTPATAVAGGTLTIGLKGGVGGSAAMPPIDFLAPAVRVTAALTPTIVSDDASLSGLTLELPAAYLTSSGFTTTQIYSNFGVTLAPNTPLLLPSGSTLTVNAARVDILSNITDPGGTLNFQNSFNVGSVSATERAGVFIGSGVTLDVRGQWTNDSQTPDVAAVTPTWQNGGTIDLGLGSPGGLLSIGDNVSLRASGGAWMNSKGVITSGAGGTIALNAGVLDSGLDLGVNFAVDGFGVKGAAGGTFSLTAPRLEISNGIGAAGFAGSQRIDDTLAPGNVVQIHSNLFSDYGFQTINLAASGLVASGAPSHNVLTVDNNTAIDAVVSSLVLKPQAFLHASASTLDGIATVATLAPYLRPSASVSLSTLPASDSTQPAQQGTTTAGDLVVGHGASITTDVGGSIALTGLDSIIVDGTLRAPGGSVSLHVLSPGSDATYTNFQSGFLANQRIELGSDGLIDVSGGFVNLPSSLGLSPGLATAGGTVDLFADRGSVLTDLGSSISIAGTTATLDAPQANGTYAHELAATAGGSLAVRSGDSISLLGGIEAATGVGTTGAVAAGSLDLALTRSQSWWGVGQGEGGTFSQSPLTIELLPSVANLPASPAASNTAVLGAAQLMQSGLDALRLESGNQVELSGAFSLTLGRRIVIDSPALVATGGARANLNTSYLEVGYEPTTVAVNGNVSTGGTGALTFSGSEIDLVGQTVTQGASDVRFVSSGDIVLRGLALGTGSSTLQGGFTVAGALTLDAERIYPVTATAFGLTATNSPGISGSVTVGQTGANPGTPLSAGGGIAINAATIASTGTLYAPFGTIALNASDSVTLGDGSLTSVSGDGLVIPFGQTEFNGQQWLYGAYAGSSQTVTGVPIRSVTLTAPTVAITQQATIDLKGGGDLSAYEWVPGSGGTVDALASGTIPGLYAILPSTLGQSAPQDPQNAAGSSIPAGQTVYLSGGAGLAAGYYPLLPARYALEPGAVLIQVEPQSQSVTAGTLGALANGTPVVAGFFSYGTTGLHQTPGYEGFAVYPGSYGTELAQYDVSSAGTFFSALAAASATASVPAVRPILPADAGSLIISVGSTLNASGAVLTAAATGGLAAPIAISANDLVVGTVSGPAPADAVTVSGTVISGWQPGSLLLGGVASADGKTIDVLSNSVTVGSGTTLTADQIVLVANQSIDVQNGATLQSTSAVTGRTPATLPAMQAVALTSTNPDGSAGVATPGLLAVSDLNWLIPTRTGGVAAPGGATVAVDAGAALSSRGSLSADAPGGVALNGSLTGPGAEWSLGSSSIAFVPAGTQADALAIGSGLMTQLGTASAVRLASSGALDLMAPVTLGVTADGTPTLQSLTLMASGINNLVDVTGGNANSHFGATTLTLQGSGAPPLAGVAGAAGATLSLNAGTLIIGPDALTVNGFASTRATVSDAVVGKGTGGLYAGGDLAIQAAGMTVNSAALTSLNATGTLAIAPSGGAIKAPLQMGGELDLAGGTVQIAGTVVAPSGLIGIKSVGNLTVDAGSLVSTAGSLVSIGNQTVGTAGGGIIATAGGNLLLASGAVLDVSGAGTAAGGSIALVATGSATAGATLKGHGVTGASFALDAGALRSPDGNDANALDLLAASLGSGGFTNAVDLRARTGNLVVGAATTLAANSLTVTADAGQVLIDGTLAATAGAQRGTLSIFGGTGVELATGGALHADGLGATGMGGKIEIGAGVLAADANGVIDLYNGGTISLDAGSTISAAGNAGMGSLLLRAPALVAVNDVAISALAADTSGVGEILVEPLLPFNTATFSNAAAPSAADFAQVQQTVGSYMSAAGATIAARLGAGTGTPILIEPGVEIMASGPLLLQSADGQSPALDLASTATGTAWRFNGAPIDLTIRATGDITVANTLSDGFGTDTLKGVQQPVLLGGPSSSIRLVAGADLASANPLAVTAGTGTLTLGTATGPVAVVRTGTGDLDLVAGKDIVIAAAGDGAYTAGTPALAPGGTVANPYPRIPAQLGTAISSVDPTNGSAYVYGVQVPRSSLLLSFPTGGGDLLVRAGEDVVGAPLTAAGVSGWQLREGGNTYNTSGGPVTVPAEWGVNLAAYNWNFGTLGGGDVTIAAGRDVLNVSAAAADSLLPQYGGGTRYVTSGGLALTAGRDIGSAQVFLADGTGAVAAGGKLSAVNPSLDATDPDVGSAFYLQSSVVNVTARLGIIVDGVFNPTVLGQPGDSNGLPSNLSGYFFSYSDTSALNLQTVAGDISLGAASSGDRTQLGAAVQDAGGAGVGTEDILPATLTVQALSGNIEFGVGLGRGGSATLFPSARGQLDLLAALDIDGAQGLKLTMSDAAPGSYATVATPLGQTPVDNAPFAGAIHVGDAAPAMITAGDSINNLSLSIPKAATVLAGQDLVDVTYFGQNLSATDQTVISAGRDFIYTDGYAGAGVSVGGPGALDVLTGRNLSLGFSQGVVTTGNLLNSNLASAKGADLTMATGLGTDPDFTDFLTKIIAPSTVYQTQLVSYVESLQGSSNLSFAAAEAAFQALPPNQQRPLIDDVFFNELLISGRAANTTKGGGFTQGYTAIDTLFPHSRTAEPDYVAGAYAGDLTLDFSRIYTLSGGDITLVIPGGHLDVGLANPPATLGSRDPSTLGIVAEGPGNVNIYSRGDIDVNASRIFTLGGGNILIWSDEGSIDAGRGAKTAVSAPPPSVLINSNGTVSLNFAGAASGSGIRTIQTNPLVPDGNVDLIAPVGTVNAGDAGIGAAGNINIAASQVVGLDNINFGGTSTGVPSQVSNISASLSGASSAAASTTNSSTESATSRAAADKESAAPLAQTALTWLDVFVTGLGEENCKPDDVDCLKRQKTAIH